MKYVPLHHVTFCICVTRDYTLFVPCYKSSIPGYVYQLHKLITGYSKLTNMLDVEGSICYIARKLYGIILAERPFSLTAVGNLCQFQIKLNENIQQMTFRDPLTKSFCRPRFWSCPGQTFFPWVLVCRFPQLPPNTACHNWVNRIQLWAVAVSKLQSQTKWQSCQPTNTCSHWNHYAVEGFPWARCRELLFRDICSLTQRL